MEGDGWNLVARTDACAYLLSDALPNRIVAVERGLLPPELLAGLDAIAEQRDTGPHTHAIRITP